MIVLIGSQKGGCGKSTLTVNIAVELQRLGKDIVIVDADRQGTASRWAQDRDETERKAIPCVALFDRIAQPLRDLSGRYDVVIVDAAGRDSTELRTALLAADLFVTPFRPSQADLDTLPHLAEVVNAARDLNPSLTSRAVLTLAPTNPQIHEAKEAKEYLDDFPEFSLCRSVVRDRKAYRDSLSEGAGVVEWIDSKSRAEIQLLVQELF